MSNYTKTTNFATKDSLSSGDPAKKIKGTEFNTEFDAIATAVATKADLASPALTGTPTAPTATAGTNTTQIATTAFVTSAVSAAGGGTVSSVAMTVPTFLSVSGSPITSSGTLAVSLSGTALPVANGGTGQITYSNGQLLVGNASGTLTKATLTAGTGITITNGDGSITIDATGTSGVSTFSGGSTGLTPSTATSGAVTLGGTLALANGGTGSTTAAGARTNLGLGTIATQNSSSVSITGGSISGITDLAIADGGTGSSTASGARTNLGLGTMATASTTDYVNVASTQTISGVKTFSGGMTSSTYNYEATGTSSYLVTDGTGTGVYFSTRNSATTSDWNAKFGIGNSGTGNSQSVLTTLNFRPATDNDKSCGISSYRWSVIYAGTGTINTSDERLKQQVSSIDDAIFRAWAKVEYSKFKFNDAVAVKGSNARWHFGLIAQRVKEAFESEGLDAFAYGLLCYDEWESYTDPNANKQGYIDMSVTAGNRYGIRYEEALALECAYMRYRLAKLEAKVN